MVSILAIGYNAFDVICPASHPPADAKHEVAEIVVGGGGPAATAAVAMAGLGARVRLVTPLADDLPGLLQRQELESAGVDFSLSPERRGCRSPRAVILVRPPSGERTIFWSRGDLPHIAATDVDLGWLEGIDLLFADSHEPMAAAVLAREARRRGLPVVLDAGTARSGMEDLVPSCSDVISSERFAPDLTGLPDPVAALRSLARLGPERVAMTFGAAGCLALDRDRVVHIPAFDVAVRDTTGAGDVFHAGYAFALARGMPWQDCLEYGSAVAALKCRDWGGRRGLPGREDVERLLRKGKRRADKPPVRIDEFR